MSPDEAPRTLLDGLNMNTWAPSVLVPWQALFSFADEALEAVGMRSDEAKLTADTLVLADLRGSHSHGVMRLPVYIKRIKSGVVRAQANISIVHEGPATALIDGGNGMGQVTSARAMALCIDKTRNGGAACVGVRNSNHNGAILYYTLMAVRHNMIGLAVTDGAQNVMAPWGGKTRLLGTNPISIAFPRKKEDPIVLDMALTVASIGRVVDALKRGEAIPYGWALDREGRATREPDKALRGVFLPIGDYKGYALALAVSMLAGVLTGGAFGHEVPPFWDDFLTPQNTGHLMAALAIGSFMPAEEYAERVDRLVEEIKRAELANGFQQTLLPGERGFETERRSRKEGIRLALRVYEELSQLAVELGLGTKLRR